jgi:hypothetical protein
VWDLAIDGQRQLDISVHQLVQHCSRPEAFVIQHDRMPSRALRARGVRRHAGAMRDPGLKADKFQGYKTITRKRLTRKSANSTLRPGGP